MLMWVCVSLSREMELLLRPPTTAINVLKFCNCSSFCQREGGNTGSESERGDSDGMCTPLPRGTLGIVKRRRWHRSKNIYSKSSQKENWSSAQQPTCARPHMTLIWVHPNRTECSNLSMSYLSEHFVNGRPQGSMLPFSLLAYHWKSMGSQLCGRTARGDDLIQTPFWNQMAKQCGRQRFL